MYLIVSFIRFQGENEQQESKSTSESSKTNDSSKTTGILVDKSS